MWFFNNKKGKVRIINGNPHGSHWASVLESNETDLRDTITKTMEQGKEKYKGEFKRKELILTEKDFDDFTSIATTVGGEIYTGFPALNTKSVFEAKINEVLEYSNGVEAKIDCNLTGPITARLPFFATDYAENKEKYATLETPKIKLFGLAYTIKVGGIGENKTISPNGKEIKFSKDFTAIIPTNIEDDYQFYGEIQEIKKVKFAGKEAFIYTTKVAGTNEAELVIPIGVLKKNITGELPKKGSIVNGIFWLEGKLNE
jgi:hypothetical protein